MISAEIEEYEQGAWVADLVDESAFSGSFQLGGSTWVGTKIQSRVEFGKYHTRVIGGANKLTAQLEDRWYAGNVSLQVAVQHICSEAGETFGSATPTVFLNTYQRIRGTAAQALDQLAQLFGQIWWIGRDGKVNMAAQRPTGAAADGSRMASDSDASVLLAEPTGVQLGVGYLTTAGDQAMQQIRHVRWRYTPDQTTAQIYPIPFLFRPPVQTAYDKIYSARVDSDNGDGTINVIADGRMGITRVPLLCGVPGAKVQTRPGEVVALAFFGGDPQKPFAQLMAQDVAAAKQVARVGDTIALDEGTVFGGVITAGVVPGTITMKFTQPVTGTITGGTARIAIGD